MYSRSTCAGHTISLKHWVVSVVILTSELFPDIVSQSENVCLDIGDLFEPEFIISKAEVFYTRMFMDNLIATTSTKLALHRIKQL